MDDKSIIDLYLARSEQAISVTDEKYGKYCNYIAKNILENEEDAKEIQNDTYLKIWNTIPPNIPASLKSYAGMICRQLALNLAESKMAEKRGGGSINALLDELSDCVPDGGENDIADTLALKDSLKAFLLSVSEKARRAFIMRYWYACSISEISDALALGESGVAMLLLRTRKKLKAYLEKEGYTL